MKPKHPWALSDAIHCGECGLPLKPAPLGGTYQCCGGKSYWAKKLLPVPRDFWARGPLARYGEWRLYLDTTLDLGTAFVQPRAT